MGIKVIAPVSLKLFCLESIFTAKGQRDDKWGQPDVVFIPIMCTDKA